jgi:hypothetical protein
MRARVLLSLLALVVASLVGVPTARGASSPITSASPCGAGGAAHYDHVVWILLENVGYSVIGSPGAPYLNSLASRCGLATNYYGVAHPSLPNYIALTSGSTQQITDDGEPSTHPLSSPSIFSELGGNWRAFAESMPTPCDRVTSGTYAARHNPAVYYVSLGVTCQRDDVVLPAKLDLGAKFTFIAPNICDDMHSCPVSTGDSWLRGLVPAIIASPEYRSRSLVLFITFDENDSGPTNHVPTLVIAPSVPRGLRVGAFFNHYSLLRTTETLLHVGLLGQSRTSSSMVGGFHL